MNESSEITLNKPTQNPDRVKSYIKEGSNEVSARKLVARDLTLSRVRRDMDREKQRTEEYERLAVSYEKLSLTDPLTGLYNRRFLEGAGDQPGILEGAFKIARRGDDPISVVMIDIDRLKEINDSNGHMIGDIMIKSIASEIKKNIRHSDFAIRYGGDEMTLVLPVTEEAGAVKLVENIRKRVGTLEVMGKDGPFSLTISSGIVSLRPKDSLTTEPTELLRAADQALYKAKEEGRNQTWIAREGDMKDGRVIFESKPVSQIKP